MACRLPGPGIEPVSPALAGRFLSTEPPEKSMSYSSLLEWYSCVSRLERSFGDGLTQKRK